MATSMKVRLLMLGKAFQAHLTAAYGHFFEQPIREVFGTLMYFLFDVFIATLSLFVLPVAGIHGHSLRPLHAEFLAELFGHCIRQDCLFPVTRSSSLLIVLVLLACLVGRPAPGAPTNLWSSSWPFALPIFCCSYFLVPRPHGYNPATILASLPPALATLSSTHWPVLRGGQRMRGSRGGPYCIYD